MEEPPTIREIFASAIEIESEEKRAKYLDEACAGDAALRVEIEGLIQAHRDAGSFFTEENEATLGETVSSGHKDSQAGTQIGPYKLLQQIGEGGMGSVWMAEQAKPVRRMVALKIIKAGMDSKQVIARFEAERQALALMSHPNIAKVLDAGATESGLPYFVMELVKGVPITEFCDKNKYIAQERLKLFIEVCRAVQHAHQKGVIHRDIKPSNVMVTLHDGVPVVKVIDFGLAKATSQKLTERTLFTAYGQMVGTPTYMSPEQAEMSGLDVDTRTDVYSLGVLLYELMTGTTPIDAKSLRKAGFAEIQRMIQQQEAPPMSTRLSSLGGSSTVIAGQRGSDPRRLSQLFRGDLDVIVAKSLDKDRSRRYSTPSDFADDVQRFLNKDAIEARPASTTYRLQKLYQRNRLSFLTAAAVACVLLLATLFSTVQAVRATSAESLAARRADRLQIEQEKTESALRKAERAETQQRQLREQAEAAAKREQAATEREKALRAEAEAAAQREQEQAQREARLRGMAEQSEREAKWNTYVARLFPMQHAWKERSFGRLAQLLEETTPRDGDPDFRGWEWYFFKNEVDLAAVNLTSSASGGQGPVAWNPKRNEFVVRNGRDAEIWDASTVERLRTIQVGIHPRSAEFSLSGNLLAVGDRNGEIRVLDCQSNAEILSLNPLPKRNPGPDDAFISGLSWSPDEKQLAVSNGYGDIGVVELRDKTVRLIHESGPNSTCRSLDWHPHKPLIAAGLRYGRRTLFNPLNNETIEMEPQSLSQGHGTAWSPSGEWLALSDGTQILIADEAMEIHQKLDLHQGEVRDVAWFDDDVLVSVSIDQTARIWDRETGECTAHIQVSSSPISSFAVEPNGSRLLLVTSEGVFFVDANHRGAQQVTTVNTSETYRALPPKSEIDLAKKAQVGRLIWINDGRHVVSAGSTELYEHRNGTNTTRGFASVWNGRKQQPVMNFGGYLTRGLRWFDENQIVLIGTIGGKFIQYDPLTKEFGIRHVIARRESEPHFDWDLQRGLGVAVHAKELHINDPLFSRPVAVLERINSAGLNGVKWSTSAPYLVAYKWGPLRTLSIDGTVIGTGESSAFDVDWHPFADIVFSAHRQGSVRVQDGAKLEFIAEMSGHRGPVWGVDVSPNGRRIASASSDGTVRIWDTATGQQLVSLTSDGVNEFCSVRWSPDGLQLVAGTGNGKLVVWGTHSLERTPKTATALRTGVIGKIIRKHIGDTEKNWSGIPVFGWKQYVRRIEPILERYRRGTPITQINHAMNQLRREASVKSGDSQRSNDLVTAMLHLLETDYTPDASEWLAMHLIEIVESEIATSAVPVNRWRDLAAAHITLARLDDDDDRASKHWQNAADALIQLLKLDPMDQVSRRRLDFIGQEYLGNTELATRIAKRSPDRYRAPLQAILQELKSTGDSGKATEAWSQVQESVLNDTTSGRSERDFAKVMMNLLLKDLSPQQSKWLSTRLAESLQSELSKQPDSQAAWEDLAQAHLMLAKIVSETDQIDQRELRQHQQAAVDAYLKVLELDTGNQLALNYVETISARLPASPKIKQTLIQHFQAQLQSSPYDTYLACRISDLIFDAPGEWRILQPEKMSSSGGATLKKLDDQSILASGPVPLRDAYTVVTQAPGGRFQSLRIEALTHPSLPNQGPGRDSSRDLGNFAMHSFQLSVQDAKGNLTPIEFVGATADYWLKDYFSTRNWNIGGGGSGESHTAVYLLASPLELGPGEKLHFAMGFSGGTTYPEQKLGCFRFSVGETKDAFLKEKQRFMSLKAAETVSDPWAKLALAFELIGDQAQLDDLTKRHPSANLGVSEFAAAKGDWQGAIDALNTALDVTPDDTQLLLRRGTVLSNLDRWEDAIIDWTNATELEASCAKEVFDRLRTANRFADAKEFGLLAERQQPEDSVLWLNLAPTLILADDPEAYREFCLRAIEQAPDNPNYTLAERLIKVCSLMPPTFELDRLVGKELLEPTSSSPSWFPPWGLSTSALLALRSGKPRKALDFIERSQDSDPNDFCRLANLSVKAIAETELGRASEAQSGLDEAVQLISRLKESKTSPGFHHLLMGQVLLKEAMSRLDRSPDLSEVE